MACKTRGIDIHGDVAGPCWYCGVWVPAGEALVEAGQVRHAGGMCPKDPSDEQIRAEAERRGLTVLGGTVKVLQRISGGRSGPDLPMAMVPLPGTVLRFGDKMYMIVRLIRTCYFSREDLEDLDDSSSERPGWFGDFSIVEVTETEEVP